MQQRTYQVFEKYRKERIRMKAVVREANRETEDRFGAKLSQDFERNRKMFWIEVKRVLNGEQGEEMRVKDMDENILIEGKAARRRWAKYFEDLLNVQNGGDRRMPVFARLND